MRSFIRLNYKSFKTNNYGKVIILLGFASTKLLGRSRSEIYVNNY